MGNRLPNVWIKSRQAGEHVFTEQITRLARGLDERGALVIFPEGGNWTPGRWRRGIRRLEHLGRPDLAERARVCPTCCRRAPAGARRHRGLPDADVIFVAHAGLDNIVTVADVWGQFPIGQVIRARWWRVPGDSIPVRPTTRPRSSGCTPGGNGSTRGSPRPARPGPGAAPAADDDLTSAFAGFRAFSPDFVRPFAGHAGHHFSDSNGLAAPPRAHRRISPSTDVRRRDDGRELASSRAPGPGRTGVGMREDPAEIGRPTVYLSCQNWRMTASPPAAACPRLCRWNSRRAASAESSGSTSTRTTRARCRGPDCSAWPTNTWRSADATRQAGSRS